MISLGSSSRLRRSRATQTLCLKPRQPLALTSNPTRVRSGIGSSMVESPIAIGGGPWPLPYGLRWALAVWTWPQPNSGSPTAGAPLACQSPNPSTSKPRSPALILTSSRPVLEVLRVGALDLGGALAALDHGVVLDTRHGLAGALGAG